MSDFAVEPMRDQIIDNDLLDMSVLVLKTLSDPARLQLLWALCLGDRTLSELAQLVGVTPNAASQLLTKLRAAGVLDAHKSGRHMIYSMHDEHSREFVRQTLNFAEHRLALDKQSSDH
ncbi:metalloregulator ArsR/SmtB family transcription factor [Glutamicibacter sp.]|uniref:ArsR/SmtB family transcription factor n=1 Tax=Glutamicibacter sp. TaxID=1931995 RepID=UPI0028BEDB2E|nr:metalloregulator ArsR/SmtB family transcription factor [Glutamicibacter sp.]